MKLLVLCLCYFGLCCLGIGASPASGQDWAGFRGTQGDGTTLQKETPREWSATDGIKWSVPLSRGGNGSPIVVGNQVFVASAEDDKGHVRSLFCFHADSGELLWKRAVNFDRTMPTHQTNPYGGTTPASDGRRVVVWHGSAGLHAYDMQGEPLWSRDLGEFRHMWGYGTSPVIIGDRVLLHTGPGAQVFVVALDLETGSELWRHEEPVDGDGERNSQNQYMGSWSTPVVIEHGGQTIAVCAMATRVCGLDVATGELVWFCDGLAGERGDLAYSSPMVEGDLCVMVGGFKGPSMAFEMAGSGDLTTDHRLWLKTDSNPQNIGTGLLLQGHLYRLGAGPNLIQCLAARTGELIWQERVDGEAFWSSIAYDGHYAYATDQKGTTVVFEPSPDGLRILSKNPLADVCNATPALARNRVYIRGYERLWCVDGQ